MITRLKEGNKNSAVMLVLVAVVGLSQCHTAEGCFFAASINCMPELGDNGPAPSTLQRPSALLRPDS